VKFESGIKGEEAKATQEDFPFQRKWHQEGASSEVEVDLLPESAQFDGAHACYTKRLSEVAKRSHQKSKPPKTWSWQRTARHFVVEH
jgi:hypothetical protein